MLLWYMLSFLMRPSRSVPLEDRRRKADLVKSTACEQQQRVRRCSTDRTASDTSQARGARRRSATVTHVLLAAGAGVNDTDCVE